MLSSRSACHLDLVSRPGVECVFVGIEIIRTARWSCDVLLSMPTRTSRPLPIEEMVFPSTESRQSGGELHTYTAFSPATDALMTRCRTAFMLGA